MSTATPAQPSTTVSTHAGNPGADPAAARRALAWFEIPVSNLDRAQRAWEAVLERPLRREAMGPGVTLAVFPYTPGRDTGGCLIAGGAGHQPGRQGTLVYLDVEPSLDAAVGRAEAAGLHIEVPRVDLPAGMGAFAIVIDTEGNRVGLHALR